MQHQTYEETCAQAATRQGLDAPRDCLRTAGFAPNVLQTGGFVMVLEAYRDLTVQVCVTQDGPLSAPYYVCAYRDDTTWDEPLAQSYVPLSELADTVRRYSLEVFDV